MVMIMGFMGLFMGWEVLDVALDFLTKRQEK
jgi:hypothetical protein